MVNIEIKHVSVTIVYYPMAL